MVAKIFDGRELARKIEAEVAEKVRRLDRTPKLASIVVGGDRTSHVYVNLKGQAAKRVGIQFEKLEFPVNSFQLSVLINKIKQLNADDSVTGIMVQMPLPSTFKGLTFKVVGAIDPRKDVDGLTGKGRFLPATVKAVLTILQMANGKWPIVGRRSVVVGRSRIVGKPLAEKLVRRGAMVTVAHSQTPDLGAVTRTAEILVSATGKIGLITQDMVKPGAVVIDVGEPKGDVDEGVRAVASFLTPVPGGVGPVTVACLLENVVECSLSHTSGR
jgi:methylenetetrahydrofolate dehydrogenase (NADP+) / methenyltetrahydrofolate cyclohydrolase